MTVVTCWWWVRHAPVTTNKGAIYGQQNLPCDCSDTLVFKTLSELLPMRAVCVTTPLRRTEQTAMAVRQQGWSSTRQIVEKDFQEQNFGLWQGQHHTCLEKADSGFWRHYWLAPARECPPEGESFADMVDRVTPVIARLNKDHAGRDIVVFAHGGTIRAALTVALGLPVERVLAFMIGNCSLTRLDYIEDENGSCWRVGCVNWMPWSKGEYVP